MSITHTRHLRPATLFWLCLLLGTPAAAADLTVKEPWVREGPPNAMVLAGYMTIENPSDRPQSVVGASSPVFHDIELHRTEIREGIARMVEQERLEVPAGGRLVLEPGGYHLMLMGAMEPVRAGDTVEIVLRLDDGGQVSVAVPVRKAGAGGHAHHQH